VTGLSPGRKLSLDFVSDQLTCGRRFRILTVVDGHVEWHYIATGKPTQNAFIESFAADCETNC